MVNEVTNVLTLKNGEKSMKHFKDLESAKSAVLRLFSYNFEISDSKIYDCKGNLIEVMKNESKN